ncbi:Protein of unknown function [Bacillus toyonensis]|nr:Protein of unknown function [Bacillus toyonensis]
MQAARSEWKKQSYRPF